MTGRWADLLPSIPEGENYLWHTDRRGGLPLFGWRTRYWSFLLKLAKARPSRTFQAQPGSAIGPFHWQNRRLLLNAWPPVLAQGGPHSPLCGFIKPIPSSRTEDCADHPFPTSTNFR